MNPPLTPPRRGSGQDTDECLFPSREGSGVGRFLKSLISPWGMHWDHEPRRGARRRASVLDCGSPPPLFRPRTRSESARGLAHSKTWRYGGRFMERGVVPFSLRTPRDSVEHLLDRPEGAPGIGVAALVEIGLHISEQRVEAGGLLRSESARLAGERLETAMLRFNPANQSFARQAKLNHPLQQNAGEIRDQDHAQDTTRELEDRNQGQHEPIAKGRAKNQQTGNRHDEKPDECKQA